MLSSRTDYPRNLEPLSMGAQYCGIWNTIFLAFKVLKPKQTAGPYLL